MKPKNYHDLLELQEYLVLDSEKFSFFQLSEEVQYIYAICVVRNRWNHESKMHAERKYSNKSIDSHFTR